MSFNGTLIKSSTKEAGLTLLRLAADLGVSRQTVNSWIGGQVPRGQYLVKLCSILNIQPGMFFSDTAENPISVPLHRTVRNKPVSPAMRELSKELAEQYLNLFRQAPSASMLPVLRIQKRSFENAQKTADWLRKKSDVDEGKPMDYGSAFRLLAKLGINTVFRAFPGELQKNSYAFYSRIAGQRVVFVNIDTNILDLIFQILHEIVHAVRDEEPGAIAINEEEVFCNQVAELAQFPEFYVNMAARYISETDNHALMINRMKELSCDNKHSLFGIYYRLKHIQLAPDGLNVGGAAINLNKGFPSLREILFSSDDPRSYVDMLSELSPNFFTLISSQVPGCSVRKFGEWLGLDTSMDSQTVMDEIARRKVSI
jgi:transcriptional regulator with XRE-family HTH domain